MGVLRLGHVKIRVLSLATALEHYCGVLGMRHVGMTDAGDALLKCWDEWDAYSLILTECSQAGADHVAWKVEHDGDLDAFSARIRAAGHAVLDDVDLPRCGRAFSFLLPSGHRLCLFHRKEQLGRDVGTSNPDPWPDELAGIGASWIDHVQLQCEFDPGRGVNMVAENIAFMRELLDFSLAERICVGPDGDVVAAGWMFRTSTPHDVAFAAGPRSGFHHVAFYVPEWTNLLRAADILSKKGVPVEITPQRHGITRGTTTYFFDPSGNRNEVFAGLGYLAQPDMPTVTWTEDHLDRGIFYHSGHVPEEFTEVYT